MPPTAADRQGFLPAATGFRTSLDYPALGYALLPMLLAVRYLNAPPDPRTYGPSHWFLDYHHGFLRRALLGHLLSPFPFLSWHRIFLIEAAVLAVAVALTYLIFRPLLFGTLHQRRLAAFLLAAPAFLPHMAAMAGELDNFLYLVVLLAGFLLRRLPNNTGLLLATLATALGLLLHEGFLLMFYPLVLILLLDLWHRRKLTRAALAFHAIAVAACFLTITVAGNFHGSLPVWLAHAQQRTDMPLEAAVLLPLHNTFAQQLAFVRHCYTAPFLAHIALTLLLSLPYGLALWHLLLTTVRAQRYPPTLTRILLATFLVPLCLIPLGHDIMRWLAALCIDISLYLLFLHQAEEPDPDRQAEKTTALSTWAQSPATAATFLYLLVLGPWVLSGTHLLSNIGSVLSRKPTP